MEKTEKIGKVTLNLEYYSGTDSYSDGDIEDRILEIVRAGGREDVLLDGTDWALLYHLSPIRENPRAIDPAETTAYITGKGFRATCCDSVEEALGKACARAEELGTFVFCAGSLYLATEALEVLGETNSCI